MFLKEFDLDIPYTYHEQDIQEAMRLNGITHNEATQKDYRINWQQKRRDFNLKTRCISAMYGRLLSKYKNDRCWKITVKCVNEIYNNDIRYIGGVCEVQVIFDILSFNSKTNYDKKKYALQKLFEGICKVVEFEKWDLQPFLTVKEQIIACDYKNEWNWRKAKRSPDKLTSAQILCIHDVEAVNLYILFKDRKGNELCKKHLITERPDEWAYAKYLGKLEWVSDKEVVLKGCSGERGLSATCEYNRGGNHMNTIAEKQKLFFEQLQYIQESIVQVALSKYKVGDTIEDLLYDVTYDTIFEVMKLIDGYETDKIKLDLVDKETGISMRENIELHDECADYLRC